MPWIQLSFYTTKRLADKISDALNECQAASVTLQDAGDQPLLEPGVGETPVWDQVIVTGLYDASADTDVILNFIQNQLTPESLPPYQLSPLEDKAWEREWMKHFQPMKFGQRTWICPSWQSPPEQDAVNILLDPGLAFGTGTHPTTALCLEWLDQHIIGGETVIDYGCGSGILGIGALKLGASEVWAVDNDPQALVATRENAGKNGVQSRIHLLDTQESLEIQADVLLANILANPLISLAGLFKDKLRTGATAVLSGILRDQQEAVLAAYSPFFYLDAMKDNADWVRLDLVRN